MKLQEELERVNGPPFNSKKIQGICRASRIPTPQNNTPSPKRKWRCREVHANTEEDKTNCKFERRGKDRLERRNVAQDMPIAYRSIPHPVTGVTPYEAMKGETVRIKLDYTDPEMKNS